MSNEEQTQLLFVLSTTSTRLLSWDEVSQARNCRAPAMTEFSFSILASVVKWIQFFFFEEIPRMIGSKLFICNRYTISEETIFYLFLFNCGRSLSSDTESRVVTVQNRHFQQTTLHGFPKLQPVLWVGVANLTMFGALRPTMKLLWLPYTGHTHFPFLFVKGLRNCPFISNCDFISQRYHSLIKFWKKGPPMMRCIQLTAKHLGTWPCSTNDSQWRKGMRNASLSNLNLHSLAENFNTVHCL